MLRFAPRYGIVSPCLVRPATPHWQQVANDNADEMAAGWRGDDALLDAALRLFAVHGLSAARHACEAAEQAEQAGDDAGARWWIAVCDTLDRPMARAFRKRRSGAR